MNFNLSDLTRVGWALTLVTIGVIVTLISVSLALFQDQLPAGRGPAILLSAPGLLIGIGLFFISAKLLHAIGFPVVCEAAEIEPIVSTMARNIAGDVDSAGDAGPFSHEEYESNATQGAAWDTRFALQKSRSLIAMGQHAEAITVLSSLRASLPNGTDQRNVDAMIAEMQSVTKPNE